MSEKPQSEKEFYTFTYQQLIDKLGPEEARKKAEWYKTDFLVKYPKTKCVLEGALMRTYTREDPA